MLEDYRKYLLGIRNNLIQCGVEFPVSSVNGYRDLFQLGYSLDSLLWYYSVLEISGSESRLTGFYLPLGNHFNGRMRQEFYSEFMDFLADYNKISARQIVKLFNTKDTSKELKEKENILEETGSKVTEKVVKLIETGIEYTGVGRYVEDYRDCVIKSNPKEENNTEVENSYVTYGKYVEDYKSKTEGTEETEYSVSGRFVEDYVRSVDELDLVEDTVDNDLVEEDGIYDNDIIEEEDTFENDLIEEGESDIEDVIEQEESDIIELDDDIIEDDSLDEESDIIEFDDDIIEEEESDTSDIEYEDDSIEEPDEGKSDIIEYEDDLIEDDSDEDDLFEEDDSDIIEYEDDLVEEEDSGIVQNAAHKGNVNRNNNQQNSTINNTSAKPVQEKDLADYLQDFTNGLLTSGKKAIIKGIRKLEN